MNQESECTGLEGPVQDASYIINYESINKEYGEQSSGISQFIRFCFIDEDEFGFNPTEFQPLRSLKP